MLTTEFDMMAVLKVRGEEAREEGFKEGRKEVIYNVAKNLLKVNRPIDEIIEVTGLARDEVEKLRGDDA